MADEAACGDEDQPEETCDACGRAPEADAEPSRRRWYTWPNGWRFCDQDCARAAAGTFVAAESAKQERIKQLARDRALARDRERARLSRAS